MFTDFLQDADNYEDRKLARIDNEDGKTIGVSTAYTSDEGYETALLDSNGVHPVERYPSKTKAQAGHEKWSNYSKTADGKEVEKLGWTGMDMEAMITLKA